MLLLCVPLLPFLVHARPPPACPSRCQCYGDNLEHDDVHLMCKWEQLNTTVLSTLMRPEKVRTLTIRCPHHGRMPSEPPEGLFRGLVSLDLLDIDRCIITRLPAGLFKGLNQLYVLRIRNAQLGDVPPGIFDYLPSLFSLDLSGSSLRIEPHAITALKNLNVLNLSNNSISFLANAFSAMDSLRVLVLDYNRLNNIDFRRLPPNITDLSIRHNLLTTIYHISHRKKETLSRLDLGHNKIEYISSMGSINSFPSSLKQLNLSHNSITIIQEGALSRMKKLEMLNLSNNSLTEVKESSLAGPIRQLQVLLAANPLVCSCSLQWMVHATTNNTPIVVDLPKLRCSSELAPYRSHSVLAASAHNVLLCKWGQFCPSACGCCKEEECACREICPPGCRCYHSTHHSHRQNMIECEGLRPDRMTALPNSTTAVSIAGIYPNWNPTMLPKLPLLRTLNISSIGIRSLAEAEAEFRSLPSLETLDVSRNHLVEVPIVPRSVRTLFLHDNPLSKVTDVTRLDRLEKVSIGGTIPCHCTNPEVLQGWIQMNKDKVIDMDSVQCEFRLTGVVALTHISSICGTTTTTTTSTVWPSHRMEEDPSLNVPDMPLIIPPSSSSSRTPPPPVIYHRSTSPLRIHHTQRPLSSMMFDNEERLPRPSTVYEDPGRVWTGRRVETSTGGRYGRTGRGHDLSTVVNALIFVLFMCLIVILISIGLTVYFRFIRQDVHVMRGRSMYEVQPLNE